jgi:hypothetical protein
MRASGSQVVDETRTLSPLWIAEKSCSTPT